MIKLRYSDTSRTRLVYFYREDKKCEIWPKKSITPKFETRVGSQMIGLSLFRIWCRPVPTSENSCLQNSPYPALHQKYIRDLDV